uniref:Uncharacterized protein n=2 Tax=Sphaerodactylus townsendi TaxID=933632 RepID=A0ACB8EQT6_9SAUR
MAQKQKELGQKVQNYKKAKNESLSLAKQTPSTSSSCERNSTKDGTSDRTPQCPDVAKGMESTLVMESSFLDQEHNQNPNVSLNEGNGAIVSHNVVGSHNEVSKKGEYTTDNISDFQFSSAVDQATLPSEPICFIKTKPSQLKETDCESVGPGRNTPPAAVPVTCELNISETTNISVSSVNQQTALVCMNETFQQHSRVNETYQTQKITNLESIHSCLSTSQKNISDNRTSLNAGLGLPGVVSRVSSPSRNSQDGSNCSAKQDSENQFSFKPKRRKKTQLLDLIEQGKIKPGDDVLEFTLQDFNHKASLLGNGKVKAGNNTVYQSPVQWIKALLGNDISVSCKYVWNKVTYCGTLLSKIVAEVHIPNESLQQEKPVEPPHQPTLSKELRFLQFNELVLIEDEEFLPQHEMDQYWNLYIHCENFGF